MTLTLELPKELETALKAEAQAHGMTFESWLEKIAAERRRQKSDCPTSSGTAHSPLGSSELYGIMGSGHASGGVGTASRRI